MVVQKRDQDFFTEAIGHRFQFGDISSVVKTSDFVLDNFKLLTYPSCSLLEMGDVNNNFVASIAFSARQCSY